ncbi:DUF6341 family protein [Robiginitalea aurantiaca]|uniref:Uracil phosphoribosyltransferase n=1 Tax=Robiginitalea aurantiaca TaxID=3056915 RepID=A0ABT7WAH0_9FLAO|nr:uracil phosphoribosyltransferase [Robiginitalea aurantiaca]MDM9629910.1 uracil phosphoribosyltransferase [Robiginitalea aurantiaca]
MKAFFEGIENLFVNGLFAPFDFFREMQNWWTANSVNWIFAIIGFIALIYWLRQIRIFDAQGEEDHTVTAHSYL